MNWSDFPLMAGLSSILWLASVAFLYFNKNEKLNVIVDICIIAGIFVLGYYISNLWIALERPPMRTLGETRLWYSFFLPVIGYITFKRWKYKWILLYSAVLAIVFLGVNIMNPDTHNKTLMPALQSPWFVPHVIVYIFSYAMLGASSLVAVKGLWQDKSDSLEAKTTLTVADNLVYIGFGFLTLGLLFGALWAKEAWGHYWTWDPKETWAFLTWIAYLIYMHFRSHHPRKYRLALWTLALAFVVLLACWFGVNYMPSAQTSVHTYTQ
ncbi:cytochrome c biogenesis protein [Aureibacter tunicatorum]|uniref:ABC-type transport system involved in cytochrome c biogenesis permease subunit n=1 Tax=Aureibacter tunicatorum TaxID=866807 RepID=A0AAE3XK23_9BACT|nr:cytochrome c biogenesis protein CcsA [Aureibacter tunicatorum]MDR6239226.1 ABC-type transport system involved in cytochrome c biogenesis permease subunit [Aureibacter tunicatorum]BDD04849.1 cytochrome c assembly protein [Aureibacter tunicatorum]